MSPRIIKIHSENNDFQHAEVLKQNRAKRKQYQEFFVEGVSPIDRAISNGWPIVSFLYSKEKPLSNWARTILRESKAGQHFELPLKLLKKLSEKEETSELIALVEMPASDLSRIKIKKDMLVLVFDRPASPGNLGTVIRSCDALRADGLIVTGHAVDIYDPRTIRASVGSLFSMPVLTISAHKELKLWFETIRRSIGQLQIIGSSAKAEQAITDYDFTKPTVLIVGNETHGLSQYYKELCDAIVVIPISGSATSLNVSCAASILLYEIDRQTRLRKSGKRLLRDLK